MKDHPLLPYVATNTTPAQLFSGYTISSGRVNAVLATTLAGKYDDTVKLKAVQDFISGNYYGGMEESKQDSNDVGGLEESINSIPSLGC